MQSLDKSRRETTTKKQQYNNNNNDNNNAERNMKKCWQRTSSSSSTSFTESHQQPFKIRLEKKTHKCSNTHTYTYSTTAHIASFYTQTMRKKTNKSKRNSCFVVVVRCKRNNANQRIETIEGTHLLLGNFEFDFEYFSDRKQNKRSFFFLLLCAERKQLKEVEKKSGPNSEKKNRRKRHMKNTRAEIKCVCARISTHIKCDLL